MELIPKMTPEQRATATPAELIGRGPDHMTDIEARDFREAEAALHAIANRPQPRPPAVPFNQEQRAAATPMELLANGSAVDEARDERRRAAVSELKRQAGM